MTAAEATHGPRRLAVAAAALFAVAIWGATPIVTKLAVADLDPLAVGLLRTLLAGLLAAPLLLAGTLPAPASGEGRSLLAASALGGFVVFPILFSLGQARTSAGHGALILAILPVLTGLIAAAVERSLPAIRWWAGASVAAAGTAVLMSRRFDLAAAEATLVGDLLVLASAFAASAGYVAGAMAGRRSGTWAVTFWGLALGAAALLPVAPFVLSPAALADVATGTWLAVAYLAAGSSVLAYAAWYWALGQGDIGRVGLFQFAQPVIGVLLAVWLLGEVFTWQLAAAGAVILAGVALARSGGKPSPTTSKGETR